MAARGIRRQLLKRGCKFDFNVLSHQLNRKGALTFWFASESPLLLLLLLLSASVVSDSVQPHRWPPTRLPSPWDSPCKNTGVDCHFLLQCMKVKSESEVAQSCPTLSDPMDCSLTGSSVHGIFQARVLEWGAIAFSPLRHVKTQIAGSHVQNF